MIYLNADKLHSTKLLHAVCQEAQAEVLQQCAGYVQTVIHMPKFEIEGGFSQRHHKTDCLHPV